MRNFLHLSSPVESWIPDYWCKEIDQAIPIKPAGGYPVALALHISPPSSTFVLLMQPQNTLIWQDPPLLRPCRNLTSYRKLKSLPTCDSPKNKKKSKGSDPELKPLSCSAEKNIWQCSLSCLLLNHIKSTRILSNLLLGAYFFFDNLADFEHFSRKECCTWRFCCYFVQMK